MSDDPVIDYMVMESVALKVADDDKKAQKEAEDKAERDKWKQDTSELESYRNPEQPTE